MPTLAERFSENQFEHRGNSVGDWNTPASIAVGNTDTIGVYPIARGSARLLHRVVCGRCPGSINRDLLRSVCIARFGQHVCFGEHSYRDAAYRAFAAGFRGEMVPW